MLTIIAAAVIVPAMPYLLSFAAGAMIYVVVEELIPEIIENYDYWSVPSLFIGKEKIFEAALFMPYETIRDGVRLAFDKALEA